MVERGLRRYETTLDRAGLALAGGAALGGLLVLGLVWAAGQRDPVALMAAWLLGGLFTAIAVTAVASPVWLVLHLIGWRGAWQAALVGALLSLIFFVGGQTNGFGLIDMPALETRTLFYRWASAGAVGLVLAVAYALIGVVMWRIAYRRAR